MPSKIQMGFHTSMTIIRPRPVLISAPFFSGSIIASANSGRSGCTACGH